MGAGPSILTTTEAPVAEPGRHAAPASAAWLVLAAFAASYIAFLAAQLGQLVAPSLIASWQGTVLLEEVRISVLGLVAATGGFGPRTALLAWPVLIGAFFVVTGWLLARRGPALWALLGYQLAAWNLVFLVAASLSSLVFRRWTVLNGMTAVIGVPLLFLLLRSLSTYGARYASGRWARLEAAISCFLAPFLILLLLFWRVNLRLPMRGPQTVGVLLGVIGTLIVLALAAAATARRPAWQEAFPSRSALRAAGLAAVIMTALAAYGWLRNVALDQPLTRFTTAHYEVLYPAASYSPDRVRQMADEHESLWPGMEQRVAELGGAQAVARLKVRLFPTLEAKYRRTRSTAPETVERGEIFTVVNGEHARWSPLADAEALLQATQPNKPELEFLQTAAVGYVAGSDLREAGRVVAEEGAYSLQRLSSPETFISPMVRRPLAAAFAAWIGADRLRNLYRNGSSGPDWRPALEESWRQHQAHLAASVRLPAPNNSAVFFQKGVAVSHEGGVRSGGYASERAVGVLRGLAAMGVDSVSLMPFAFMPAPDAPVLRMFTGESDESLDHMTYAAHQAGLRVMLKPQIWLRGGKFSGDIQFDTEEDFQTFWRAYRQWILHYARLARNNRIDLLCIGTELRHLSTREKEWRKLVAEIRRVYPGPLTYAANWGREFEETPFWDALDYIGLNNYYPLAEDGGDTSPAQLQARADQLAQSVAAVASRWKKPVLLTEVGYPSQAKAAAQPWLEDFSARSDPALQARLYEAVFQAFYKQPWFAGMYWWKWPSSGHGGGPDDPSLTPLNKPAAQVVRSWYQGPTR